MNDTPEPTRLPVELPNYTGPLDLLVHLISKHELDVCSISIAEITDAYLKKIREMENKDLEEGGEYLVLGATLIRYKSRALLPKEETEPEEEEINDQILELRRLEYERFRALAEDLKQREELTAALIPRVGPSPEGPREVVEFSEVSVYDLYQTFQKIISEIGAARGRIVEGEDYSVDEKMLEIEALLAHNEHLVLTDYLRTLQSKLEIIVVFLALLELVRLKEIRARQDGSHTEIVLVKGPKFKDANTQVDDGGEAGEIDYDSMEEDEASAPESDNNEGNG